MEEPGINSTTENKRVYDLEERTFIYAKTVCKFCKRIEKNLSNNEYHRQLIRSSASVGANYIEANEALSKKRFSDESKNQQKRSKGKYFLAKVN